MYAYGLRRVSALGLLAGVLGADELPDVLLETVVVGFGFRHVVPGLRALLFDGFELLAKLDDAFEALRGADRRPDLLYLLGLLLLDGLLVRLGLAAAHSETDYSFATFNQSTFVTKASKQVFV